jgi:hypothetical protein
MTFNLIDDDKTEFIEKKEYTAFIVAMSEEVDDEKNQNLANEIF